MTKLSEDVSGLAKLFIKARSEKNEQGMVAVTQAALANARARAAIEEARHLSVFADAV